METGESSACAFSCEWCRVSSQMSVVAIDEKGYDVCCPWQHLQASTKGLKDLLHSVISVCSSSGLTPPLHTLFPQVPSIFRDCPWSTLLISRTHLSSAGWPYGDTHCLVWKRISLPWRRQEDHGALNLCIRKVNPPLVRSILPSSAEQDWFEKQLDFSDSLANLCLRNHLGFIIVIQVYLQKQFGGDFFSIFHYSNSWKSIRKVHLYVCPDVEPCQWGQLGLKSHLYNLQRLWNFSYSFQP